MKSEYKKPNALSAVMGLMGSSEKNYGLEDKGLIPTMEEAIKAAPQRVYRLNVRSEKVPANPEPNSVALKSEISNLMSWTGKESGASVDIALAVIDLNTGKVIDECKFSRREVCESNTATKGAALVASGVTMATADFLWNAVPVEGVILQKGVEQSNGKTKESQCYIDLAENYGLVKDMKLGVYEGEVTKKNLVGMLKIKEVMGEDISHCSITKGESKIEKLLKAGAKLIVSTRFRVK